MYVIGAIDTLTEAPTEELEARLVSVAGKLSHESIKYRASRKQELERERDHLVFELTQRERECVSFCHRIDEYDKEAALA